MQLGCHCEDAAQNRGSGQKQKHLGGEAEIYWQMTRGKESAGCTGVSGVTGVVEAQSGR
jgi:hypothetical protein